MRKLGMFLLGCAALILAAGVARAAVSDDEGGKKFTIHGEVRFRGEYWDNLTDFTDTDPDLSFNANDSFDIYPYRVRLAAKGDLGHDIWVYGEFQNAGVAGNRTSEIEPLFGDNETIFNGGSETILYQGWVKLKDLGDSVTDLTFGRQEIVFDRGLHFSDLNFYNGISHDGVMASWDWEDFGISGFWTRGNDTNVFFGFVDATADSENDIYGVHFNHLFGKDKDTDVAYYAFYQTQNVAGLAAAEDRGSLLTLGGRWGRIMPTGKSGWEWNIEGSYQTGDFSCFYFLNNETGDCDPASNEAQTLDQKAWVAEGELGYSWGSGKTTHRVWGGATYASGDDDPNDMDQEAFTPLFPDFHNRLGSADLFTVTNIQSFSAGWSMNIDDRHIFGVSVWDFGAAEAGTDTLSPLTFGSTGDALAEACFDDTTPPAGESCEDHLGNEIDLMYDFNMTQNFAFNTALAWFESGDAIEDHWGTFGLEEAGSDSAWRLTIQARARF